MNTRRLDYPTNLFTFRIFQRIGPLTNILAIHPAMRSEQPNHFANQGRD